VGVSTAPLTGLILGPAGSGKGTQAARIALAFDMDHLSTGDVLRAEAAQGSALGRQVERVMAAGELVPDRLMISIVKRHLWDDRPGAQACRILLDGFPRTLSQAIALDEFLASRGRRVDFVVGLRAPDQVLSERLLRRSSLEGRADDTPHAIMLRMSEFRARNAELIEHYQTSGVPVDEVHASGSVEAVFERVEKAITNTIRV
jgi:adenylate kinase